MLDQIVEQLVPHTVSQAAQAFAGTQLSVQAEAKKARHPDTVAQAIVLFDLRVTTQRTVATDPLASVKAPAAGKGSASQHPYTIWQAIAAVGELFQPQAVSSASILNLLDKVSGLIETNVQSVTNYQNQVTALQNDINHESTSESWMNWGMAVLGVVFGAVAGLAIGGPAGMAAALIVGTAMLLGGSQIEIDGKPLLNFILDKVSDGKINLGSTSLLGYAGDGAYDALTAIGVPKGEKSKEIIEGATQIVIGVAVGLVVGNVVSAESDAAAAAEEAAGNSIRGAAVDDGVPVDDDPIDIEDDDDDDAPVQNTNNDNANDAAVQRQQANQTDEAVAALDDQAQANDAAPAVAAPTTAPAAPAQPAPAAAPQGGGAPAPANQGGGAQPQGQGAQGNGSSAQANGDGNAQVDAPGAGVGLNADPIQELNEAEEGIDEIDEVAGQSARREEQVEEERNPGGIARAKPRSGLRGFVTGLTTGNSIAQADTKDGNAYSDLLEAAGVSKSVAGWVGMAIGMGVNVTASVGGFTLGAAPGASNQLFARILRYAAYVQPLVTAGTSSAEAYTDIQLYKLYSQLQPLKTALDNAEGEVQTVQLWEKSVMGMMSSTTDMITQTTETAIAMLNQTRQTMQTVFEG